MGFGTRNAEGERILKFGDAVGTVVCNKLNTYQYGDNRSMIDYLMVSIVVWDLVQEMLKVRGF